MDTNGVWNLFKYSYGIVLLIIGLDKVLGTHLVVEWSKYVSPYVENAVPIATLLIVVGVIEVIVGALIFTRYGQLAFYISTAWLVLIALDLLSIGGYFDIAVRDLLLAVGTYAAARLAPLSASARIAR
jgi:hypothetical protein